MNDGPRDDEDPLRAVRLIAFDDVPLSSAYAGNCSGRGDRAAAQLGGQFGGQPEVEAMVRETIGGSFNANGKAIPRLLRGLPSLGVPCRA